MCVIESGRVVCVFEWWVKGPFTLSVDEGCTGNEKMVTGNGGER